MNDDMIKQVAAVTMHRAGLDMGNANSEAIITAVQKHFKHIPLGKASNPLSLFAWAILGLIGLGFFGIMAILMVAMVAG